MTSIDKRIAQLKAYKKAIEILKSEEYLLKEFKYNEEKQAYEYSDPEGDTEEMITLASYRELIDKIEAIAYKI